MAVLSSLVWEDEVTHHYKPRMFTAAAWATLTESQRDLIRYQRMAVVEYLADQHYARYHDGVRPHADLAEAIAMDRR